MNTNDSEVIIKVEDLYKKFCRSIKRSMLYGSLDVARNMLGISYDSGKLRKSEFWSLEDVNFQLRKGEAMGVIGQNGSGKSTLLRLINGIYPPDRGEIMVKGRIGALIAVGAGFHPHMTGRENIYLNGTILGMTTKEINAKFDDIVKFADLGEFMDAPVATYSSGMSVRLGFSIAIHSDPEILLADEVLAVGDLSFALKCYRKIAEYRQKGGTIILVSHNMQLIRNVCQSVLWLDHGKTRMYGETQPVCDAYETFMLKKDSINAEGMGQRISNDPDANIDSVEFVNAKGEKATEFITGESFTMRINYDLKRRVEEPIFTMGILTAENIILVSNYTNYDLKDKLPPLEGKGYLDYTIDQLYLKPGNYQVTVTFADHELQNVLDWHEKMYTFSVNTNGHVAYGLWQPPGEWNHHVGAA